MIRWKEEVVTIKSPSKITCDLCDVTVNDCPSNELLMPMNGEKLRAQYDEVIYYNCESGHNDNLLPSANQRIQVTLCQNCLTKYLESREPDLSTHMNGFFNCRRAKGFRLKENKDANNK